MKSYFLGCRKVFANFQKKLVTLQFDIKPDLLVSLSYEYRQQFIICPDKVLCRFCFKPKKVTDEVLRPANSRKIQILISDIIVLKTALDSLPFISKVNERNLILG